MTSQEFEFINSFNPCHVGWSRLLKYEHHSIEAVAQEMELDDLDWLISRMYQRKYGWSNICEDNDLCSCLDCFGSRRPGTSWEEDTKEWRRLIPQLFRAEFNLWLLAQLKKEINAARNSDPKPAEILPPPGNASGPADVEYRTISATYKDWSQLYNETVANKLAQSEKKTEETIHYQYSQGSPVDCSVEDCEHLAVVEYYGFCPKHWLELEPYERAILAGKEPPVVRQEQVVIRPARSRTARVMDWMWRIGVTGLVAYLYHVS